MKTEAKASERNGAAMDWLTLRFRTGDLEARYRAARFESDLKQMRFSLLIAAAFNGSFALIEPIVLSQNVAIAMSLRIGIVALFAATFGLSYHTYFKHRLVFLGVLSFPVFTLAYTAIITISNSPDIYDSGYVLAILFMLYFVPLGFLATSTVVCAATILFAVLMPITRETSPGALIIIYGQFVAALAMGMVALYWLERLQRRDFLNLQEIAAERSRYHDLLNRILPDSIVERLQRGEVDIADDFADSTGVGLVWKIQVIDLVRFWCRDGRPKTAIRDNGPLQGRILSRRQGRAGEGGNAPHRQKRYDAVS